MLVKTKKIFRYEDKENDYDVMSTGREVGDKTLLDCIEIEPVGEQLFRIARGEETITTFSKKDYEDENVDLTLKMLKSKVVEIVAVVHYLKTRGTRETKNSKGEITTTSCYYDNFLSSDVTIKIN